MGHDIKFGIDPNQPGPARKHFHRGGDARRVETLCHLMITPHAIDEVDESLRYVSSCRECRVAAWEMIHGTPYPSQH